MIKFFKLVTGEELIAEVEDTSSKEEVKFELSNPFKLMMTQQGLTMVPYPARLLFLNVQHVTLYGEAADELANVYHEATGGIVVPKNKLLVPN